MDNRMTAIDAVKQHYVNSCHKPQKDRNFDLESTHGEGGPEYGNKDHDGKALANGQVKSFEDHDHCFRSGVIYHNINNMWWVITGEYEYSNVVSFHLYDPESYEKRILDAMNDAEEKAWAALRGYKFWMFGYHAAAWVKYNKLLGGRFGNPWRGLVGYARELEKRYPE